MMKYPIPSSVVLMILAVMSFPLLSSGQASAESESDPCVELRVLHEQAFHDFKDHRGEKRERNGLFGKVSWFDYNLTMWGAQAVKLWANGTGQDNLVYTYCQTSDLESAKACYQQLIDRFTSCKLKGYVRNRYPDTTYIRKDGFTDKRDKDEFANLRPEFIFELSSSDDAYEVELTIVSKWTNTGSD